MTKRIQLMIVGAQKSGTSSLLRYLAQHPDIHTHAQSEMTFFLQEHEYTQGYDRAFAKYFAGEKIADKPLIAKNVMVMHFREVMQRIYDHNPEIHLVVLLREPVARAYSAYWWARRRGWENIKTYEEALATEKARLNEDRFKWRQCVYQYNSIYYPHVKNLIDQFGRNQVHCFLTDDLKENAEGICQQLFNRIGIRDDFKPSIGERHNQATMPRSEGFNFLFTQFLASRNPLRKAIRKLVPDAAAYKLRKAVLDWNERPQKDENWTPPPLDPETRKQQMAYFKPFNEQLAELLDRDLTDWL
ncbi:MAG: sulfotransferase domain-containing protein [Candidatus Poribacteria bacterium]|nr:sulfotransferase domain-containing protein [Candidatus Poribacteria bacterium]